MNFLDYRAYVMDCLGIGDIVCSFNALENMARECGRKVDVYVVDHLYFQRVFDIYNSLDLKLVNLHLSDLESIVKCVGEGQFTIFQAFGMEVSWIKSWPLGWGLKSCVGYENMVRFKGERIIKTGIVGVSFTVNSNPSKNISKHSVFKVINELLEQENEVIYFGFRKETDEYLERRFGANLGYCNYDLRETIKRMGDCERFVGADSGMSWIAAFHRVETQILIGREFGRPANTFGDIPWVSIHYEGP